MGLSLRMPGSAYAVILGLCLAMAYFIQALGQPGPDVAWINYGVGRLLQGDRLYRDIIEVNPPFIYELSMPPFWLARLIGGGEAALYRLWVLLIAALSSLACYAIALRGRTRRLNGSFASVVAHLCLTTILIGESFGQREHVLFMLLAPYVFLCAARIEGRAIAPKLAASAGAAAACAVALKPHYAVVLVLLEALHWRMGVSTLHRLLRPEIMAGSLAGLLLLFHLLLTYPAFISEIVPLARRAYLPFMRETALVIWSQCLSLFVLACAYATIGSRAKAAPEFWAFLAAAVASIAAALLQYRGFRYQLLPGLLCILTASPFLFVTHEREKSWLASAVSTGALLVLMDFNTPWAFPLTGQSLPQGSSVAVLSTNIAEAFPSVPALKLHWTLRVPSLWFAPFIASVDAAVSQGRGVSQSDIDLANSLRREAVADLVSNRPRYVLLQAFSTEMFPSPVDHLAILGKDPRFAKFISHYMVVWSNEHSVLYALQEKD